MRLIDEADARRRIIAFATGLHSTALPVDTVMMLLTQVPTIDAVPVVRCKDCKWYEGNLGVCYWCSDGDISNFRAEDDFCSYGEQKEGADNAT